MKTENILKGIQYLIDMLRRNADAEDRKHADASLKIKELQAIQKEAGKNAARDRAIAANIDKLINV